MEEKEKDLDKELDKELEKEVSEKEAENNEADINEADINEADACEDTKAEANEEEAEEGDASKSDKKLFKKKDKKADAAKEKIAQLEDRVMRQMAEFENFRKRSEKEKQQMFETGAKSIIEKVLPVIDNFERGLGTVPEDQKDDPFVNGMNMVYKQLVTELEAAGVKPIEAVGKEFDPAFHNAVMQSESDEYESGIVDKELQKGYTYRDSVVRHSMVSVVS